MQAPSSSTAPQQNDAAFNKAKTDASESLTQLKRAIGISERMQRLSETASEQSAKFKQQSTELLD